MAEKYSPTLFARNLEEWRTWLEENHSTEKSIHLVVYHKSSKTESVHWHDAIEHALCYGWVDSIAHKRDPESCYLKFSPRNPKSKWGKRNIERANKMINLGFMREPGFKLIETAKSNGKWVEQKILRRTQMKPRISLITLGVDDLEESLRFYRDGLGLATQGIIGTEFEYGAVAFFDLQANLKLALYPRKSLAKDSGLPLGTPSALEFSIGHNVSSKAEVNQVMEQAKNAGAVIVKPAQDTFWGGYAGYFQDPNGHLWEIAWNPQWPIPE